MGKPKTIDKEFREFRIQYEIETLYLNKLIKDQSFWTCIILTLLIAGFMWMNTFNIQELKEQNSSLEKHISYLDTNINYLYYHSQQLESKLNQIEAKLNTQTVPFCKAIGPNGQIGVGINASKLNETCG